MERFQAQPIWEIPVQMMRLNHRSAKTLLSGTVILLALVITVTMLAASLRPSPSSKRDFAAGYGSIKGLMRSKKSPSKYVAQSVRPDMYPRPSDRDVVDVISRRTRALLADIQATRHSAKLAGLRDELKTLREKTEALRKAGKKPGRDQYAEFAELYWRISLANELIDFDAILFVKRHLSR